MNKSNNPAPVDTEKTAYAPSYFAHFRFSATYCIVKSADKCTLPDTSTEHDAVVNRGAAFFNDALNINNPSIAIRINTAG